MKADYSKSLSKFVVGIIGVTGISLLITLPSRADEVLNPHPEVLDEAPDNRSAVPSNSQPLVIPTQPTTNPGSTQPGTPTPTPGKIAHKNIVALVESNRSFTILTKALKDAGLIHVLEGPGPFTIFAPSDRAFNKLPKDALRDLLKPENKEVLVKILTYHVVPGRILSSDLKSGEITSLQGDPITIKAEPGKAIGINDATVTTSDIQGQNGVIHEIDNVILPPSL